MLRQMAYPFAINLCFFTFVFLMSKILDIMQLVVNYRASLWAVLAMIVFVIPYFLVFVIPLSVMMSVLLTFLRMSADNEIVALKAGGVGMGKLIAPVLCFCAVGAFLTAAMTFYGLPWGKRSLEELVEEVAATSIDVGLKERNFNDNFEGVMLYVSNIDIKTKTLIDVFIEDQRTEDMSSTVIAPKGKLFSDPEKKIFQMRLYNGLINQVSLKNRTAHTLKFDTYDLNLELKKSGVAKGAGSRDESAMWFSELRRHIESMPEKNEEYYEALLELHKKFSMPAACIVLGFLAFPLGLQAKRSKRSFGLGLGLLFFLLFYLILSAGKIYGETGEAPPALAMWAPNIVLAVVGIYFMKRALEERPFNFRLFSGRLRKKLFKYRTGTHGRRTFQ